MNVLVTGGAGYIGSVIVEQLIASGHQTVVVDNLSQGQRAAVHPAAAFVQADLAERETLVATFEQHQIEAVIHLAASTSVGESVKNPVAYYHNNVTQGLALLDAIVQVGLKKLVFASSAAVYGEPEIIPVKETAPTLPTNPYGETKLAFERALRWYEDAYGLRSICLRYFNVGGATERCGEAHAATTRLIPTILRIAAGQGECVWVYGEDYDTPDGTCIRDYVHVLDVAEAHLLALKAVERGSFTYNLGYGCGYSVAEVVEMARQVTGLWISTEVAPRRAGDPITLIANPDKIMLDLGWQPRRSELDSIIQSAWQWVQAHPQGYAA